MNGTLRLCFILVLFIACKEDPNPQIVYCYSQNKEGRITNVLCGNISEQECLELNNIDDLHWSYEIGNVCKIVDPPLPN